MRLLSSISSERSILYNNVLELIVRINPRVVRAVRFFCPNLLNQLLIRVKFVGTRSNNR